MTLRQPAMGQRRVRDDGARLPSWSARWGSPWQPLSSWQAPTMAPRGVPSDTNPHAYAGYYLMTEGPLEMEMTLLAPGLRSAVQLAHLQRTLRQAKLAAAAYGNVAAALGRLSDGACSRGGGARPALLPAAVLPGGRFGPIRSGAPPIPGLQHRPRPHGALRVDVVPPGDDDAAAVGGHLSTVAGRLAPAHQYLYPGGTSLLDGTAVVPIHDQATCAAQGGSFLAQTGWMVHLWLQQPIGKSLFAMDRPQP